MQQFIPEVERASLSVSGGITATVASSMLTGAVASPQVADGLTGLVLRAAEAIGTSVLTEHADAVRMAVQYIPAAAMLASAVYTYMKHVAVKGMLYERLRGETDD